MGTNTETTKKVAAKSLTSGKAIAKKAAPKGKAAAKGAARAKGKGTKGKGTTGRTFTLSKDDGRYNPYRFTDDMRITAAKSGNPSREGTESHKWYAIAVKAGTVGKFKAAIKANKADPAAKFPFDHLRIHRRNGALTVK